jgi:hypothetical protein
MSISGSDGSDKNCFGLLFALNRPATDDGILRDVLIFLVLKIIFFLSTSEPSSPLASPFSTGVDSRTISSSPS